MTDKEWTTFLRKVGTRIEREVEKYGRWDAVKYPTRAQANVIYDMIKKRMKAESAISGKKNTNYMRTFVSYIFKQDGSTPTMTRSEYKSTKDARISALIENFGLGKTMAEKIVDTAPPTPSDKKYGRKNVGEFWARVEALQKELRKEGHSWSEINHMIGVAYFGKEY